MKQYNEIHCQLGNDDKGNRAWLGGKKVGQKSMDDATAATMNAQFENTGIRFEMNAEEDKIGQNLSSGTNEGPTVTGTSEVVTKSADHEGDGPLMIDHVVTQEDLDANPELIEKGVQLW